MAVIISDSNNAAYDGKAATANGFYRVEAYNMGCFSQTALSLSATRTIAVTFANSGNCQGIHLGIILTAATTRSVQVDLQEFSGGAWVTRATVTKTVAQYADAQANYFVGLYFQSFKFSSPYPVTTAGSTWRFQIQQTGGSGGNVSLVTSDGTNPYYAAWCDNQVTLTNNDCMIVDAAVDIDKSFALKGVLGTGSTAFAACGVVSANLSNPATALFTCLAPTASYTVSFDGQMVFGTDSGFQAGTQSTPISAANKLNLVATLRTVGTNNSGFHCGMDGGSRQSQRQSLYFYGAIPTNRSATLESTAATGQANIVTTVDMSAVWSAGDKLYIGKRDVIGHGNATTEHTIQSISGKTITLTSNLTGNNALAGGKVINPKGYGISFDATSTGVFNITFGQLANFVISGCSLKSVTGTLAYTSPPGGGNADSANRSKHQIVDNVFLSGNSYSINSYSVPPDGCDISRNHYVGFGMLNTVYTLATVTFVSGTLTIEDNIAVGTRRDNHFNMASSAAICNIAFNRNIFQNSVENSVSYYGTSIVGAGEFNDNEFWGLGNAYALAINKSSKLTLSGNTFNKCALAVKLNDGSFIVDTFFKDNYFGNEASNTYDLAFGVSSSCKLLFSRNNTKLTIDETNKALMSPGSIVGFQDDGAANVDYDYTSGGLIVKTGSGLTDTTVRTSGSGKYAMRQSSYGTDRLVNWSFHIPTGNIKDKTMTVSAWVKIAAAAYWAGTHEKPRLYITYDDETTVYAEATETTEWQRLSVTFTPLTTFGDILVEINGNTDATGSDAYVYIDDFNVAYPAGISLDLGGLDIWANGLPVTPPIAGGITASDVWAYLLSAMQDATTIGGLLKTNIDAKISEAGSGVTLAALQPNYAPAKAGDAMTLTSAYDAAKTAAQAGDPMALTASAVSDVAAAVDSELSSKLTTLQDDVFTILVNVINQAFAMIRLLGLSHENCIIKDTKYDADGNLIEAKMEIYLDAESCNEGVDPMATYSIEATGDGEGKFSYFKQTKL